MITLTIIGTNGIIATAIIYFIFMLPAVYTAAKNEQPPFLLLWMLLIVLLPGIGTVVYAVVYTTRKKRKIRFEIMPDNESAESKQQKTPVGIPENVLTHILTRLDSFEKKEAYLKPGITLAGLAKDFNVSSGHLSKAIRFYKEKRFNGYINTLRIDYLIEELRSGSDYRKYRMKPLAGELGFGNERAFTIAFLRRTGMYPTVFIAELGFDQEEEWVLD